MIIENIAKAIKKTGKSRYQIAKDTGIDQAVLCRIATGSGTGSCTTKTADILCKYLGLELLPKKEKSKRQVKNEHLSAKLQSQRRHDRKN